MNAPAGGRSVVEHLDGEDADLGLSSRGLREKGGALERSEVETLAAYVAALGGKLKVIADFGDETLVLG